jgi:hypothetical protein
MRKVVGWLNARCTFCNGRMFYLVFVVSVVFNPVASWMQAYKAWTVLDISGISFTSFFILFVLQSIGVLYGIRIKEPALFLSMSFSFFGSLTILLAKLVR